MRRSALGSAAFFVAAPGTVAGLVPWLLTGFEWQAAPAALRIVGAGLLGGGVVVLAAEFVRFVREGRGTPAPVAPTEGLVVGGSYRWVRNPMYLAVGAMVAGEGLLLGQPVLAGHLAVFAIAVAFFVRLYEEPTLQARFGRDYERYRRAVPRWLPRVRPWRENSG